MPRMTKEDIKKRIEILEENRFYLAMKDTWNAEDYRKNDEWFTEIIELKKLLNQEVDMKEIITIFIGYDEEGRPCFETQVVTPEAN